MRIQRTREPSSLLIILGLTLLFPGCPNVENYPTPIGSAKSSIDDPLKQKISSYFSAFEKQHQFTGYVLVATQGKIVFELGRGPVNLSTNSTPTDQTRFQIGSLTKQFVAASVLALADQDKIDLNSKIGTYMSGLPTPAIDLTIHQLLSNTSGLASAPFAEGATQQLLGPATREELLATFAGAPLHFPPGSRFEYSNSGYLLLGALIEEVTGKPASLFLAENLFDRAEMPHTFLPQQGDFQHIRDQRPGTDFAHGLRRLATGELQSHEEAFDMSVVFTAGAMVSTAHDLFQWNQSLYSGQLFSAELVDKMTTENIDQYCYGIYRRTLPDDSAAFAHSGGIYGFHSYLLAVPSSETTVVVLSNDENQYIGRFGEGLAALAGNHDVPHLSDNNPTPDDLSHFTGVYAGSYLGNIVEFNLIMADGKLNLLRPNGDTIPLIAEQKERFFIVASRVTYSFVRVENGTVFGLNVEADGIPVMELLKKIG